MLQTIPAALPNPMYASAIRPFSNPLTVQRRAVFGPRHLNNLHQTASLPSLLELGRSYLLIHNLERSHACFLRIYNTCLLHPTQHIPLLFASACLGLARTNIAAIKAHGGINGPNDHSSSCMLQAEHAVSLLDRAIADASTSVGVAAPRRHRPLHQLFLGQALGCVAELLETLPELDRLPSHGRRAEGRCTEGGCSPLLASQSLPGEPISPVAALRGKIAESFVNAVRLCVEGLSAGQETVVGEGEKGERSGHLLPRADPYSGFDWYGDALVDVCRFNKQAVNKAMRSASRSGLSAGSRSESSTTESTSSSQSSSQSSSFSFVKVATRVVQLVCDKFGTAQHAVVGQALHDLGRLRSHLEMVRCRQ